MPISNDRFVHLIVSEFIQELAEMEYNFLKPCLKNAPAAEVFHSYMVDPISLALIDSFSEHCQGDRQKYLEEALAQMSTRRVQLVRLVETGDD